MNALAMLFQPNYVKGELFDQQILEDSISNDGKYFAQILSDKKGIDFLMIEEILEDDHLLEAFIHYLQQLHGESNLALKFSDTPEVKVRHLLEVPLKDILETVLNLQDGKRDKINVNDLLSTLGESMKASLLILVREFLEQEQNLSTNPSNIPFNIRFIDLSKFIDLSMNENFYENSLKVRNHTRENHITKGVHHANPLVLSLQQSILQEFETLLANENFKNKLQVLSAKILNLLNRWLEVSKNQEGTLETHPIKHVKSETLDLWNQLFKTFEKRQNLASRQLYNHQSKVTSADVHKWLQQVLQSSDYSKVQQMQQRPIPSGFITPIEQYNIYLQQQSDSTSIQQQFLKQFRQIMDLKPMFPMQQLALSLKPENLGEMLIRFTQVDGEMSVKILVSTQAAKRLLESNLHQLKNMFSPHQVIIEHDEDLKTTLHENLSEQKDDDQSNHQHAKDEQPNQEEREQSEDFQSILNEKV